MVMKRTGVSEVIEVKASVGDPTHEAKKDNKTKESNEKDNKDVQEILDCPAQLN